MRKTQKHSIIELAMRVDTVANPRGLLDLAEALTSGDENRIYEVLTGKKEPQDDHLKSLVQLAMEADLKKDPLALVKLVEKVEESRKDEE